MKLHVGCGSKIFPGWTNLDIDDLPGIDIIDGGKGYTSPPNLSLVNPETGIKYDTGLIKAKIQGSAISELEILETPVGLNEVTNIIFTETKPFWNRNTIFCMSL